MEKYIRPAALRAGIQKRLGWHTLRHTFGTLLKANGEDVGDSSITHATCQCQRDDGPIRTGCNASEEAGSEKHRWVIGPRWTHARR